MANTERYLMEAQATTRATPNAAAFNSAAAFDCDNIVGLRMMVAAQDGSTNLSAGTLKAWMMHKRTGVISRNSDKDLTIGTPGHWARHWNDEEFAQYTGWLLIYATDSLNTAVNVHYSATVDSSR